MPSCAPRTFHGDGQRDATRVGERTSLASVFPPVRGIRLHAICCQWRLAQCSVYALPFPCDPLHVVVFCEPGAPDREKNPLFFPIPEARVNRTGASELFRQCLLPDAGAQHVNNRFKDLSCRHRLAPRSRLAFVRTGLVPTGRRGNQRLDFSP